MRRIKLLKNVLRRQLAFTGKPATFYSLKDNKVIQFPCDKLTNQIFLFLSIFFYSSVYCVL